MTPDNEKEAMKAAFEDYSKKAEFYLKEYQKYDSLAKSYSKNLRDIFEV